MELKQTSFQKHKLEMKQVLALGHLAEFAPQCKKFRQRGQIQQLRGSFICDRC